MCGVTFITFLCFSEVQQEKPVNMVRLQHEFGVFYLIPIFFVATVLLRRQTKRDALADVADHSLGVADERRYGDVRAQWRQQRHVLVRVDSRTGCGGATARNHGGTRNQRGAIRVAYM